MPSPRKPRKARRLCIYGDSHLGAVKRAVDQGLVDLPGTEVEYWGAPGPAFRMLKWDGNEVSATGEAIEVVKQINASGRTVLRAEDFDSYLFYGARLGVVDYLAPYLHRMQAGDLGQSRAVLRAAAFGWFDTNRSWHVACHFAARGADVTMLPCPLPTQGVTYMRRDPNPAEDWPLGLEATRQQRDGLWQLLVEVAADHGVTFLPQPDETIVQGFLTDARFGIKDAAKARDPGHKTPEFAALCLARKFNRNAERAA